MYPKQLSKILLYQHLKNKQMETKYFYQNIIKVYYFFLFCFYMQYLHLLWFSAEIGALQKKKHNTSY